MAPEARERLLAPKKVKYRKMIRPPQGTAGEDDARVWRLRLQATDHGWLTCARDRGPRASR